MEPKASPADYGSFRFQPAQPTAYRAEHSLATRPRSPGWSRLNQARRAGKDILADTAAGGFEGFEPFTTPTLPVNDENMATLEKLVPKYKLRVSGIYWDDDFHLADQHDRLVKDSHRFFGYLKRFGAAIGGEESGLRRQPRQ